MTRGMLVLASGLLSGLLIGALGMVIFVTAWVWDSRTGWSEQDLADEPTVVAIWSALTDEYLHWLVAAGVAGAVNGAIGAWNGRRSKARKPWPVLWVPLLLLLLPLAVFAQNPGEGSKGWGGALVVVVVIGVFVWVAGRVGQELGARTSG